MVALHLGAIGYTLKPSARDTLAGAIRKLEARSAQGTRRVLVVEDDPALRQSIHALLKSETVEIVEAGTIAQALEQINRTSFDCIVMDLALRTVRVTTCWNRYPRRRSMRRRR